MRNGIFLLLGLTLLLGLFWLIPREPSSEQSVLPTAPGPTAEQPESPLEQPPAPTGATTAEAAPKRAVLRWELEGGRVHQAPESTQLQQGDRVRIELLSDSADELHLHGYDLRLDIAPNTLARLEFEA
ncbi:MAG: hypothetical protein ACPHCJ_04450, partial [Oceanococcaceae bacterium]